MKYYTGKIHKLGEIIFINPDCHERVRAKWSAPVRKYWKISEQVGRKQLFIGLRDMEN